MKMLSLVVPCFNEEEVLPLLYKELCSVAEKMKENEFEFIFVDDGSRDKTLEVIKSFTEDRRVKYISFSRNFGKEAAMLAGLRAAAGDYVAVMDADMQDPPSMLPEMLEAINKENADSAATRRVSRKGEPPLRSLFARLFYRIFNKSSGLDVKSGSRDFRLMTRRMKDAVVALPDKERFSKAIYEWVGFKTVWLEYKNVERAAGKTKWSFKKLFDYALTGVVSFTQSPLKIAEVLGALTFAAGAVWGVADIILACVSGPEAVGYQPIIVTILLVGGAIMLLLGVLGRYLAQMFKEVKGRPEYIVRDTNI